jgi:hypothetical protein
MTNTRNHVAANND